MDTPLTHEELKVARKAYNLHANVNKYHRFDRNGHQIAFKLTFEEWLNFWLESGHWFERGRRRGQYVMSRIDDLGDYELGNIVIKLHSENVKEGWSTSPRAMPRPSTELNKELGFRLGKANKGRVLDDEHKRKISESVRRAKLGKPWSEARRAAHEAKKRG